LCIEGKLEEKTDEELDELIEYYETMSDGERSKLLRDRKT
jgi:hypothetical protein